MAVLLILGWAWGAGCEAEDEDFCAVPVAWDCDVHAVAGGGDGAADGFFSDSAQRYIHVATIVCGWIDVMVG